MILQMEWWSQVRLGGTNQPQIIKNNNNNNPLHVKNV